MKWIFPWQILYLYKVELDWLIIKELSKERQEAAGMLIADLDGLKKINDTLGHLEGDRAITAVAETLRKHFRKTDIVGRIGGDEFMIYLRGVSDEEQLCGSTARLCEKIRELGIGKDNEYSLGISVGIVLG